MFRVQGDDEKAIAIALPNDFCQELVDYVSKDSKIYLSEGTFEITSDFIRYMEGPYEPNKMPELLSKAESTIEKMLSLAKLIENN
jgi:regulator of sigma D